MLVLWQGQIGEMKKCSTKRTYLNVPIQVQLSGNSEEKELNIDCELVENNLTNKTMLYDEWKTGTHSSSAREKHRAFVFQSTSPDHYSNLLTTQVRTTYECITEANHPLVSNEWSYLSGNKSVTHHQGRYNWNKPSP